MTASRRLYILLVIGAVLFALSYFDTRIAVATLCLDAVVALAVVIDFYLTPPRKVVSASRAVSERLSIGRQNDVIVEVFNQSNQQLHMAVRDDFPQSIQSDVGEFKFDLAANSKATLKYALLPRQRGKFDFENINIRYLSRLGLFWRSQQVADVRHVKVYSDLMALKELSVKLSQSSELGDMRRRRRGQGTEFASLREYVSGDDTRDIDWKATARRERPVVRTYEIEQEQTLMVLVDAGRMMLSDLEGLSRFEHALNAALALALTGLHRNDQVGFGIFADKPILFLPPRRGKGHITRILEAACNVDARMVEPDYAGALSFYASAQKSRSLMVVLTDLTDPTGSQTLLAGLSSLSPRHLPFCVTLRDRQIETVSALTNIGDEETAFKRAIASDLIVQRELAFSHLARRGCLVLDCPPQEISEKLVDRYLDIKARGRL